MKNNPKKSLPFGFCALMAIILCSSSGALSAECAGKSVAECADALAAKVNSLQQENATLNQIISSLRKIAEEENKSISDLNDKIKPVGPDLYQCPEISSHEQGSLGGGSWGFYGCMVQITTQNFCSVIEFPKRTNFPCTKVGKLHFTQ